MAADEPQPNQDPSDDAPGHIRLAPSVFVSDSDLTFRAVRSTGPGGQNVNKRSTKVELRILIDAIPIDRAACSRLKRLAGSRLNSAGELIVTSEQERSQRRNRDAALAKLRELVARALVRPKPRRKTKPSRGSIERRLTEKKQRGETKRRRQPPKRDDS